MGGQKMVEIVILIGLPASGKSTFYQQHFAATHIQVSKDLLPNNKRPARRQLQLLEEALQQGQSVVIDNTNASCEERAPLIALGQTYQARIIGYYLSSPVKACLERNQQRSGKARVPNIALFVTLKRLVRPSLAEGFDQLYDAEIVADGNFSIADWVDDDHV
jgi:predicted kinase